MAGKPFILAALELSSLEREQRRFHRATLREYRWICFKHRMLEWLGKDPYEIRF